MGACKVLARLGQHQKTRERAARKRNVRIVLEKAAAANKEAAIELVNRRLVAAGLAELGSAWAFPTKVETSEGWAVLGSHPSARSIIARSPGSKRAQLEEGGGILRIGWQQTTQDVDEEKIVKASPAFQAALATWQAANPGKTPFYLFGEATLGSGREADTWNVYRLLELGEKVPLPGVQGPSA